ncbi:MAG: TetR-like C-terminal domain-containing protein [Anaerocolumna aminovalerica]|uniref:TetR-like C-terminal domain-containing protein n=1 Tax=Anaerocolumna aminovalerica TaxID=1527 RepID=UPI001FA86984|nr:TetR-like C-terminal domain-containing protein [Anaerocolumna aminovalerica]MDU6265399.1 TetR-like C-terminal domain-containing protein [Anaerocolumna aminovalerica]
MIKLPPIAKYSRADIIAAALNLVRKAEEITARGLGAELGTSTRPIFTAFRNMEEVQRETVLAARALYNGYVERGLAEENAFKGVGMQYIAFAREEPGLFRLLFMTAYKAPFDLDNVLPAIDENSDKILASIQNAYGLSWELSYRLYQNLWIFTHGIACLYATGVSRLTEEEVSARLTEVFTGLLIIIKKEVKKND